MLVAELTRSTTPRLPVDSEAAVTAALMRGTAGRAATLGADRGDLWAGYAFTYATLLWPRSAQAPDPTLVASEARAVVEKALAYAPHNSSLWLLAASLGAQFNWWSSGPAPVLNMSYYTGLSELPLTPLRLHVATHSTALADSEDASDLSNATFRMILTRWHELKPALIATYKDAAPEAKRSSKRHRGR